MVNKGFSSILIANCLLKYLHFHIEYFLIVMAASFNRIYKIKNIFKKYYPPYWDEGLRYYPKYRPGRTNPHKRLLSYQVRMYRSWKHNRKPKFKNAV